MKDRALVLGGGGPVGIAWEIGVLAGLSEAGVKVGRADFILGTSAGSFVGSQVADGRDLSALFQAQRALGEAEAAKPARPPAPPSPGAMAFWKLFAKVPPGEETPMPVRLEFGALSQSAEPVMDETAFIASFGGAFGKARDFPHRFGCTAVDVETGAFKIWRAEDGAPLAKAVASSCSVPGIFPPIAIGGRRWMDGGVRSSASIDAAAPYKRVLALVVRIPAGAAFVDAQVARETAIVRAAGNAVDVITPDPTALEVFGANLMDARNRKAIAEAGFAQGLREADRVHALWQ